MKADWGHTLFAGWSLEWIILSALMLMDWSIDWLTEETDPSDHVLVTLTKNSYPVAVWLPQEKKMMGCFEVNQLFTQALSQLTLFSWQNYPCPHPTPAFYSHLPRQNTGNCDHHGHSRPKKVNHWFWLVFASVFALHGPWTFWQKEKTQREARDWPFWWPRTGPSKLLIATFWMT